MLNGKAREMGLGPYPVVTLERAREKAIEAQRLKADASDPIDVRAAVRAAEQLEAAKAITFKHAAERYIAAHQVAWKNAKHGAQWSATLTTYAYPCLGMLRNGSFRSTQTCSPAPQNRLGMTLCSRIKINYESVRAGNPRWLI
jgi:hypothetical protein